ncbi:type II secretion system GspH family protein [Patescibacteria group bacterium]|nr:type II secretion system GspH family protein [Patescibacteria group bacterium]
MKKKIDNLRSKNGFLLAEETLKIIIAVICILFLAYLLFSLYSSRRSSIKIQQAEGSLLELLGAIQDGNDKVIINNPTDWFIHSWPKSYSKKLFNWVTLKWESIEQTNVIPLTCETMGWESCLCICKKETHDSCESDGICLSLVDGFKIKNSIEITPPSIELLINQTSKLIQKRG